ncbi:MAG: Tex-like N-terminal domain-containing protein, partial [Rikenellaceae bacterium]
MDINNIISKITGATTTQCSAIIALLEDGATVPFISRYRKERTQGADEVVVLNVKNEYERLLELMKRKATILATIEQQGALNQELKSKIDECFDSNLLEDIYLPYKPKRRTRAAIAKERGLEPLAKIVMAQNSTDISKMAARYINEDVPDDKAALEGVNDIIAEWINENSTVRDRLRGQFNRNATLRSSVIKSKENDEEATKYSDYFDFEGNLLRQPSHRLLAIFRAHNQGFTRLSIVVDNDYATSTIENSVVKRHCTNECKSIIKKAILDSYSRLIKPSLDNELLAEAKERADKSAIDVFAQNLRQLLLSAPLGQKNILAIDPGYRTGCKVVCLDKMGDFIHNETIYPHEPQNQTALSIKKISSLVESYKIEAIAIGDGTASRQTENLIKRIQFAHKVEVYMVSEDGASVYSASAVAREEFPSYDVTVRGAISIGRRLLDPLSELVKIDPKSIGVGQYQHDVDQNFLKRRLDDVVESCVNSVGVNLNSASYHLLSYVSGIGETLSKNIIEYRRTNGNFTKREELLKVPRLGAKAFQQCAGFLRIKGGSNPLDGSAVHPESYSIVKQMAQDLGCSVSDIIDSKELRNKIEPQKYTTKEAGMATI